MNSSESALAYCAMPDTRALIRRMWKENPLWGEDVIAGELAKLGHHVSARTVAKYRPANLPRGNFFGAQAPAVMSRRAQDAAASRNCGSNPSSHLFAISCSPIFRSLSWSLFAQFGFSPEESGTGMRRHLFHQSLIQGRQISPLTPQNTPIL